MKKLVTHNGSFHSDDIFAAATLSLYLEKKGEEFEIIRTRDEEIIKNADYVFDVGGIYDEATNRFDHHQKGGAGQHENGIEYASIGLVWKKFGIELCGSKDSAELIERKLIEPIDAGDNAISLFELKNETMPYLIQSAFNSFNSGWKDSNPEKIFQDFLECVKIAKKILVNEISRAQDIVEAGEIISSIYKNTEDKRIIVLDKKYPYEQVQTYSEPLYVLYPRIDTFWGVEGVPAKKFSIERRKNFPEAWAGLRDEDLQKVTGVSDAIFCHRGLFLVVAKSKEGAIALARKALGE